jgi:SAM-dependent methyltransferase
MRSDKNQIAINQNIERHERIAHKYDEIHGEILNPVEQDRLQSILAEFRDKVSSASPLALDFGCGSGNITRQLLVSGFKVVAADVTPSFTRMSTALNPDSVIPFVLNGTDLTGLNSDYFDLSASYSVLHHIPDYLAAVRELVRVTKSGGFIILDHDASLENYHPSPALTEFRKLTKVQHGPMWYLKQLVSPRWWVRKVRKTLNPRYAPEGDIHVWPDDHIEWDRIRAIFHEENVEIVRDEDYLLYYPHYPIDLYNEYKDRCSDVHLLIGKKL